MNKIDHGGHFHPQSTHGAYGGITRRDQGAIEMAAALVPGYANSIIKPEVVAKEIAKAAYLIIDALIAEGKK